MPSTDTHVSVAKGGTRTRWENRKLELPPIDKFVLTVSDVCLLMGCSHQTVIRTFEKEPGTLIKKFPRTKDKRGRRTIRIPRAVYERVARRLTV